MFGSSAKRQRTSKSDFKDPDFYLSHFQKDAFTDKGLVWIQFTALKLMTCPSYSLRDGASFAQQAENAAFDLTTDEGTRDKHRGFSQLKWDRKKKKFVKGDGAGADNMKIVKTESGARLPATYRRGRFDEWRKQHHKSLPKVGEAENPDTRRSRAFSRNGPRKFTHNSKAAPKPLDKLSKDYDRKVRQLKKKNEGSEGPAASPRGMKKKPTLRHGSKPIGKVKSELKSVEQIRKSRKIVEQKRAKNARPTRKGKGRHR